ncbi:sensor histidine kinase [uncultured Megasphaera sp.]|jgi:hypothetical protein|uniref:sensor histidine kinase n=1 Tax=uncultured Megasphaera sp. TaxID=165188 RepID=UPI0025913D9D|nr:sensor histidine kinase [uncultured Megasphaera sp.]
MNDTIEDICHRDSALSDVQIQILKHSEELLQFAGDLSHRELQLFVPGKKENTLVLVAWRTPFSRQSTVINRERKHYIDRYEEPVLYRVLKEGNPVYAGREVTYGHIEPMYAYPFVDNAGVTIAVVAFFGYVDAAKSQLTQTAYLALQVPQQHDLRQWYRPLSVQDGIVLVDDTGVILYADEMAEEIMQFCGHRGSLRDVNIYTAQQDIMGAKVALASATGYMDDITVENRVFTRRVIPLLQQGKVCQVVSILTERTELYKKEEELLVKTSVIREIHHRVKNNLQTISGLLRMQLRRTDNDETKRALQESVNRILSISLIHDILAYHEARDVDMLTVTQSLASLLVKSLCHTSDQVDVLVRGESIRLSSGQATSMALILNELITNAVLHGFAEKTGVLSIDIHKEGTQINVCVADTGKGMTMPSSLPKAHLGLELVRTLIETDLQGTWKIVPNQPTGTKVLLFFPCPGGNEI